ncbi:MAG: DUF6438 domain-containing protein [Chitinophagales bacterium]|jgi:hypothetical protein|nr:DUF6438 domain-containing protein [Chitinophagales bacterium]
MKLTLFFLVSLLFSWSCGTAKSSNKDKLSFDQITYYTSTCYGSCPAYEAVILSDKSIKLKVLSVYIPNTWTLDSNLIGDYSGNLSDANFSKLKNEVDKINFDKVPIKEVNCCDAPIKLIEVKNSNKVFKIRSMSLPIELSNLERILFDICHQHQLTKVTN